jgi:biopolymer transport protein ExbD
MAMNFDREPYEPMSIDMTPLVDCIFAIILFLLVTSSQIESMEQDLSIELPTMSRTLNVKAPPGRPVVVNVRFKPGGPEYHIENEVKSLASIRSYLSTRRALNRDQSVVIRGDRNVKWDHVAAVMRTCAEAGIGKVSATYEVLESR